MILHRGNNIQNANIHPSEIISFHQFPKNYNAKNIYIQSTTCRSQTCLVYGIDNGYQVYDLDPVIQEKTPFSPSICIDHLFTYVVTSEITLESLEV